MSKKLPAVRSDHSAVLSKAKKLSQITQKILDNKSEIPREVIEEWMRVLWEWADANDIPRGKLPRDREKLLALKEIEFFNMGLEKLPDEFCNLEQLTSLGLWDNWFKALPERIINLKNLDKLNLRGNPLTLTARQENWINELRKNGCIVYSDNFAQNKVASTTSSKTPSVQQEHNGHFIEELISFNEDNDEQGYDDVIEVETRVKEIFNELSRLSRQPSKKIIKYKIDPVKEIWHYDYEFAEEELEEAGELLEELMALEPYGYLIRPNVIEEDEKNS